MGNDCGARKHGDAVDLGDLVEEEQRTWLGLFMPQPKVNAMITDMTELTQSILALPVNQRADLAEAVWQSLEKDEAAIDVAIRRAEEIDAGEAKLVSHDEVMRVAREAIRCG